MCDVGEEEEGSEGNQGASFSCFNPYFSHKSSLRGKTLLSVTLHPSVFTSMRYYIHVLLCWCRGDQ